VSTDPQAAVTLQAPCPIARASCRGRRRDRREPVAYHLAKLGIRDVVLLERKQLTPARPARGRAIPRPGCPRRPSCWDVPVTRRAPWARSSRRAARTPGSATIGHLHLACTPQRLETLTREGDAREVPRLPSEMVGPGFVQGKWPVRRSTTSSRRRGVPDEGRVNPADFTPGLREGAPRRRRRDPRGRDRHRFTKAGGRVTGVVTDRGTIECETVVNAAGMWGRQLGALAGVSVPLQAAEHYYLLTDVGRVGRPRLPRGRGSGPLRHTTRRGRRHPRRLFEPKAARGSLDDIPADLGFAVLPPDWDRMAGFLSDAMDGSRRCTTRGSVSSSVVRELHPDNGPLAGAGARAPRVLHARAVELASGSSCRRASGR